jgi:competence protein ComEC
LIVAIWGATSRSRALVATGAVVVIGTAVFCLRLPSGARISFLPVGQGDSTLVELPSGHVLLIDAGGSFDDPWGVPSTASEIVRTSLDRRGIDMIDVVIVTHPHPDHLLGLFPLLDAVGVGEIWQPGYDERDPLTAHLLAMARFRRIPVKVAREVLGAHSFGETSVTVVAPAPGDDENIYGELGPNDNSLVVQIAHGNDRALLAGDVEALGEELLLLSDVDLRSGLLKAPHHGSRTSSTPAFIARVAPIDVVCTTGRNNRWAFPHVDVVSRYTASGARVWDTARNGEIAAFLTGEGIRVVPFRGLPIVAAAP